MSDVEQGPRSEDARGRRRRTLTRVGLAMMVVGVAVLGHVGWQLYGTTFLAQRELAREVDATERAWAHHRRPASRHDRELARDVVALIRIPALGDDFVIPAHRGTDDDTLERGFGIFDGSPDPGSQGNFALGGHRITHGEPLRRMRELEPGDQVIVETADATYRYVLDYGGASRTVDTDATWVTDEDPVDPETRRPVSKAVGSSRLLTLVTCAELFHTDERWVAFGHLVAPKA